MIPAFVTGLAEKFVATKIGGFLHRVPTWVYALIIGAILCVVAFAWHQGKAHHAIAAAEKRGADAAYASIEAQARKLEAKANAMAVQLRSKNDETMRRISSDADDLRLRGPGKASCSPATTRAASGPSSPGGQGAAALDQMPDRERGGFIALPFSAAIAGAEQCDANRAEVLSWREWHRELTAAAKNQQ